MKAFRIFGHHGCLIEAGICAMLCLACGAEMRLVEVVEDTTMLVSGYEHQTWQCSGCSSIERRMTFTREKRQTHKAPVEPIDVASLEPAHVASLEPSQMAAAELVRTEPVEPAAIMPIQAAQMAQAEPGQTAQAEPSQTSPVQTTVSVEATHEPVLRQPSLSQSPSTVLQTNVSPKPFDEKLRKFMERATALREAAAKAKRDDEFNRDWDEFRPVSSASTLSTTRTQLSRDKPLRSSTEPVAAPMPTAHDEPVKPESEHARRRSWKELLRFGRRKSF